MPFSCRGWDPRLLAAASWYLPCRGSFQLTDCNAAGGKTQGRQIFFRLWGWVGVGLGWGYLLPLGLLIATTVTNLIAVLVAVATEWPRRCCFEAFHLLESPIKIFSYFERHWLLQLYFKIYPGTFVLAKLQFDPIAWHQSFVTGQFTIVIAAKIVNFRGHNSSYFVNWAIDWTVNLEIITTTKNLVGFIATIITHEEYAHLLVI